MNSTNLSLLASAGLCFALASCANHTPDTRIAKHPALFSKLTKENQQLVEKGEIQQGMSMDAVYLAWGKANQETDTFAGSKRTTRWDYTKLTPVYSNSFYGGVSFYRPHRYHCRGSHVGLGSRIHYQKSLAASVFFEDTKVKSWEITR